MGRRRKTALRLETEGELHEAGKTRRIVIEYYPSQGDVIVLRASGLRTRHAVTVADVYTWAARRTAEIERQRKRLERRGKGRRS